MRATRSTQLLCSRLLSWNVAVARQCSFRYHLLPHCILPTRLTIALHSPSTLVAATITHHTATIRAFSNTTPTYKKGGKAAREASRSDSSSSSSSAAPATAVGSEDPFDFSALESDINDAVEKLKTDLSQLRQGGRFNPQVLESLRVQLKQGGPVKLGDLAQVVPKGRVVQVVVGEQEVRLPFILKGENDGRELTINTAPQTHHLKHPIRKPKPHSPSRPYRSKPIAVIHPHPSSHCRVQKSNRQCSSKSRRCRKQCSQKCKTGTTEETEGYAAG